MDTRVTRAEPDRDGDRLPGRDWIRGGRLLHDRRRDRHSGWFLKPLRDALQGAGHRVAYAVLRAPLSACKARAEARELEPLGAPEAFEQMWRSFSDLGDLERNVLELGDESPAAVADLLEKRMGEGLLEV
jgi:hypothetical protein